MGQEVAVMQHNPVGLSNLREKIETIKQTVAKGATDAQLEMFLTLAEQYQLSPFLKEIWFVPNVGIITGRDGYLKVAQRDPDFDGIVSAAVCEGDEFSIEPITPTVNHRFGAKRGPVIGAYAVVFHKKRRPAVCYAPMSEYKKSSSVWTTYQSAMICKVAEVLALKRQFGINGLVTEEEVGQTHTHTTYEDAKAAQQNILQTKLQETTKFVDGLDIKAVMSHIRNAKDELIREFGESGEARYKNVLANFSVAKPSDIKTLAQAKQVLNALTEAKTDLQMNGADVIDVEPEATEQEEMFSNA